MIRVCRCATALVLALLASGCHGASAPTVPPVVSLTDGAGLSPKDEIDGLDAVVGTAGTVHVVWQEQSNVYGGYRGSNRIVYRRGSGTPLRWGPRVVIADDVTGKPQIVAANGGVHVFAGGRLRHWWLAAGSNAFKNLGDMLGDADPIAGAFDAIATGDGITLAFAPPYGSGDATVYRVHWTAGRSGNPLAIATTAGVRAAGSVRPILHTYGARVMLLWANIGYLNVFAAKPGQVQTIDSGTNLDAAWSDDGGLNWVGPDRVAAIDAASARALALAGTPETPVVLFAAGGLFQSELVADAWRSPMRIARYKPGSLSGSADTSTVAATQCNRHTAVAWVDAGNRRSDRRWWNPLGGFPWSDNPDWFNNDLFVATDLPKSASMAAKVAPLRLTADLSMTRDIAIIARGGRLLVFRSGRSRVRKAPYDAGAAPEVTLSSVPCS